MAHPQPARLTVTGVVYHQVAGQQPVAVPSNYSAPLTSEDSVYGPRTFVVGEAWEKINTGWLSQASVLVLENRAGEERQTIPTREEQAEIDARVIEVVFLPSDYRPTDDSFPYVLVRPGRDCRFEPADLSSIYLRCRAGQARVTLTLVPA